MKNWFGSWKLTIRPYWVFQHQDHFCPVSHNGAKVISKEYLLFSKIKESLPPFKKCLYHCLGFWDAGTKNKKKKVLAFVIKGSGKSTGLNPCVCKMIFKSFFTLVCAVEQFGRCHMWFLWDIAFRPIDFHQHC